MRLSNWAYYWKRLETNLFILDKQFKVTKTHTRYVLLTQNEPKHLLSNTCVALTTRQKFGAVVLSRNSASATQSEFRRRDGRNSALGSGAIVTHGNYCNSSTTNDNWDNYLNLYSFTRVWYSSGNYNFMDKLQDRHCRSAEIRHHRNSALQKFWSQWRDIG